MKKLAIFVLTLTLVLALVGCGKTEPEYLRVYSFNGENEQFTVSNGVIVLGDTKEIFYGGELKATDDFFVDTASCSATFYILQGDEQKIILSNSVIDMTGGSVNFDGDLGKISGDGVLIGNKIENIGYLENNLYFELTITDNKGAENEYQLKLSLTEVTQETTKIDK